MGSPSEHRFSTQVMNICIVFNSFSVVLLQQIQRVLHFALDNESLSTEDWRATKIVRGPKAHVFWRDTDKLGLFSLVKRRTRGTLILLTNVWRANKGDGTKLFLVISVYTARNSGHKLQLGALCPYTQILSLACQPQWKQEFTLSIFSCTLPLCLSKKYFQNTKKMLLFSVC